MAKKKQAAPAFKLGDYVRVLHTRYPPGRIVELRGPLGPGGAQIYRVRIAETQRPTYIELPGDGLELVPAAKKKQAAPAFKLGDYVRIRPNEHLPARIVELRGPLTPGGVQVYRIRLGETRPPTYIELPENLLELVSAAE